MVKSKLMYVKWGKGQRRVRIKYPYLYEKIGKVGWFNLYRRKKGAKRLYEKRRYTKVRKRKVLVKPTKRESEYIKRLKRTMSGSTADIRREREVEKRLLGRVKLLPIFKRGDLVREAKKGEIITDGRLYKSFSDLEKNKKNIYLSLMDNLVKVKNKKFMDRMYALRGPLLRDSLVLEVDVYGILAKNNKRVVFLGTLGIVGLLIEEAGFIESELIGWSGENREIEAIFDRIVKGLGGQKCYWIKNNMSFDTEFVMITNVNLRFSYA